MDTPPGARIEGEPLAAKTAAKKSALVHAPSIVVACFVAAIAVLSIWYLIRREPSLLQGEVDATRMGLPARVDGRVGEIPVVRGQARHPVKPGCGALAARAI